MYVATLLLSKDTWTINPNLTIKGYKLSKDLTKAKKVFTRKDYNYDNFDYIDSPMLDNDAKEPEMVAVVVLNGETPKRLEKTDYVHKNYDRSSGTDNNLVRNPINKIEDSDEIEDSSDTESDSSEDKSFESGGLDIKQDIDHDDNTGKGNDQVLRKALRSCNRRAYRKCKEACTSAYKITCSEFYCSRRKKNSFRKSCKTNCRLNFD
ncbi:hypothetical protein evm_010386 [Chilo suppressalis]|nr:hypothetical protein evm_010386 [Chilo suppressalis]